MPWHWKDGKPVAWVDVEPAPAKVEPEQQQPTAPPMREPGWVELFLAPNEHGLPLYSPPRAREPRGRSYHRKPLRRG